eukprot:COSAG02_NODE_625_length_19372_cov_14.475355_3_plen_58_part_00
METAVALLWVLRCCAACGRYVGLASSDWLLRSAGGAVASKQGGRIAVDPHSRAEEAL